MLIAIVYYPGCDVINFDIDLTVQAVFRHDQKVKTKKRAFKVKQKAFSIIFKEHSVVKNSLRPESALMMLWFNLVACITLEISIF